MVRVTIKNEIAQSPILQQMIALPAGIDRIDKLAVSEDFNPAMHGVCRIGCPSHPIRIGKIRFRLPLRTIGWGRRAFYSNTFWILGESIFPCLRYGRQFRHLGFLSVCAYEAGSNSLGRPLSLAAMTIGHNKSLPRALA